MAGDNRSQRSTGFPAGLHWLVASLVALLPTYLLRLMIGGVPTTVWELALYAVVAASLFFGWLRWSDIYRDQFFLPILGIVIAGTGAVFISPDSRAALGQYKALVIDAVLFYYLLRSLPRTLHTWSGLFDAYILGAGLVALHAIWTSVTGAATYDGRTVGIFALDVGASPNYLALFVAPAAVYAIVRAGQATSRFSYVQAVAGVLLLVAVVLSGSRAGLLACGIAIFLNWFYQLTRLISVRFQKGIVAGMIILSLGIAVVQVQSFRRSLIGDSIDRSVITSDRSRWEIWQVTLKTIVSDMSIFGIGWSNYQEVFREVTQNRPNFSEYIAPFALHPHNFLLTTLVTLGWLGLISWLWILAAAIRGAWLSARTQLPWAMVFITWFIHGLVDTTYYKNDLAPLTWLILVPLLSLAAAYRGTPNTSSRKSSTIHSQK